MTAEPAFVGDGRHAVVAGLVEAFDRIRAGGPARWIALEAPSGWGKTRVLRELYRRLATERQPDPGYWPADILGTQGDAPDDVGARRKRLVPEVTHTPGSLPGYLWWGIACSLRGGVASAALRQDLGQVQAHADHLEDAWRQVASSRGRWAGGLRDAGLAAADEAAMEAAGTAIETVLGAAIPGLGLVRWLGERGVASVRAAADRRERLASADRLEAGDLVSETAAMISRLAVPGLPVVITVEDLHAADAGLADLLATLVGGPASVLVVSTSWPGRTDDNEHVQRAMAAAGDRVVRLDHRTRQAPDPFGPAASLSELGTDALASLVRHYYPQVDATTLAGIVDRYPNPLALELFCQLPRVRRRGRSGTLHLDPATIAGAPAEIRGLYAELWNELPETVREALSLAALGIPSLLDPDTATEWNAELLMAALEQLDWPSLDEIGQALRVGGDAYSWARSVSTMLRTFNEPDQRAVAVDDDSFLFDEDRVEVRTAIAAALGRFLATHLPTLVPIDRHHVADLAVVLHAEGFLTDADVLADAVRPGAELIWDDQRDLPRIIRMLTRVIDARPSPDRLARTHLLRGHASLLAGRLHEALDDADRAADAPDAPELFRIETLNLRARALSALRHDDDAIEAHRTLAAAMARMRGDDHPDTIAVQSGLALALGQAGHDDEALDLLRETSARAERTHGPEVPYTLGLRGDLALTLSERGRADEALEILLPLEQDCRRLLGPQHPRTLTLRHNTADALVTAGDREGAEARLRSLVPEIDQVFGPDHPRTFLAQRLLGGVLALSDDEQTAQEGVDLLVAMHAREVEVLGWDHPTVQATRRLIADLALGTGEHELAIRTLEQHLATCGRLHGERSVPVLDAQVHLGRALAVAGRSAEAIDLLQSAVDGLLTVVDPQSDEVFSARQLLGRTWADAGDTDHALDQMHLAVEIATHLWGPSDLRTLDARDDIARALYLSGQHRDALLEWEQLAADVVDDHGPDHHLLHDLHGLIADVRAELQRSGPDAPT